MTLLACKLLYQSLTSFATVLSLSICILCHRLLILLSFTLTPNACITVYTVTIRVLLLYLILVLFKVLIIFNQVLSDN
jgi:hypothetical protein